MNMTNYPLSLKFEKEFLSEQQCIDYLYNIRWPDGYRCPRCQYDKAWEINDSKYKCQNCGYQTTVTAGTLFHNTHKPLTFWFRALWCIVAQSNGTISTEIQTLLNMKSYRTTWTWLHKIRQIMFQPKHDKLIGTIECGIGFLGGTGIYRGDSTSFSPALIAVALEVTETSIKRVRLTIIDIIDKQVINEIINDNLMSKDIIDNFYSFLRNNIIENENEREMLFYHGYIRPQNKRLQDERIKYIENFFIELNKWLPNVSKSKTTYLAYYLDEFCFKYNNRKRKRRDLFDELLKNAVQLQPTLNKNNKNI